MEERCSRQAGLEHIAIHGKEEEKKKDERKEQGDLGWYCSGNWKYAKERVGWP